MVVDDDMIIKKKTNEMFGSETDYTCYEDKF